MDGMGLRAISMGRLVEPSAKTVRIAVPVVDPERLDIGVGKRRAGSVVHDFFVDDPLVGRAKAVALEL